MPLTAAMTGSARLRAISAVQTARSPLTRLTLSFARAHGGRARRDRSSARDCCQSRRRPARPRWNGRRDPCVGRSRAAVRRARTRLVERAMKAWTDAAGGRFRLDRTARQGRGAAARAASSAATMLRRERGRASIVRPAPSSRPTCTSTRDLAGFGDPHGSADHRLPHRAARARARARAAAHRRLQRPSYTASGDPTMGSGISGRIGSGCDRTDDVGSRDGDRAGASRYRGAACALRPLSPASGSNCYDGIFMKYRVPLARDRAARRADAVVQEGARAGTAPAAAPAAAAAAAAPRRPEPPALQAPRPAASSRCRRRFPPSSRG